jgi:hypothetical protein
MSAFDGRMKGDQVIEDEFELSGTIAGNVTVVEDGYLALYGTVTGNLVVLPGGRADVFGTVHNGLWNRGGGVYIAGTVYGSFFDEGGESAVDPDAVIHEHPF